MNIFDLYVGHIYSPHFSVYQSSCRSAKLQMQKVSKQLLVQVA